MVNAGAILWLLLLLSLKYVHTYEMVHWSLENLSLI